MRSYYRQRAPEYDDWWNGTGLFEQRDRPGWHEDVAGLCAALEALPAARARSTSRAARASSPPTCRATISGVDQSEEMLAVARERLPDAELVVGDGLHPPFGHGSFERIHAGTSTATSTSASVPSSSPRAPGSRASWSSPTRRCAPDGEPEAWQERKLNDGSRHQVYKRWFTPEGLIEELGGGEVVFAGAWFVSVRARASSLSA